MIFRQNEQFQNWLNDQFPAKPTKRYVRIAELPAEQAERVRLYMREYWINNRERLRAYRQAYTEKNRDKINARRRANCWRGERVE